MYLDAGVLHSYIHGTGIEIMANSDNVLRGGLTPKHVDVDELLSILSFHSGKLEILNPTATGKGGETAYAAPAGEFALNVIYLKAGGNGFVSDGKRSVEILFCVAGKGRIAVPGGRESIDIRPGESYLVPAAVPQYKIDGKVKLFKAAVPLDKE
jgi:mannose-6-phosphate isomerase